VDRRYSTTVVHLLLVASIASLGEGIRTTQLRHHNDANSTTKGTGHLIFQHKQSVPWVSVDMMNIEAKYSQGKAVWCHCLARGARWQAPDDACENAVSRLRGVVRMGGAARS